MVESKVNLVFQDNPAETYSLSPEANQEIDKVYKATFSLSWLEQACNTDTELRQLFPNIATIKQTIEQDHFFADYCFNAHLPQKTLDEINRSLSPPIEPPLTQIKLLKALKAVASNKQMLLHIDIPGWSGGKEVFEIQSKQANSFCAEQLKTFLDAGINCAGLTFDSNGWGQSRLSQQGMDILKQGPHALRQHMQAAPRTLAPEVKPGVAESPAAGSPMQTYLSRREWADVDPMMRDRMPGGTFHASHTTWMVLHDLMGMRCKRIYNGHSQGDKIINEILSAEMDSSPNAMGVGLAGGHADQNFRGAELQAFYSLLLVLEKFPNFTKFGDAIKVTPLIKKWAIETVATANLPKEVKDAIVKIHLAGTNPELIELLLTQLHVWSAASGQRLNPKIKEYGGHKDNLIPNQRLEAWAYMSPFNLSDWQQNSAFFCSYPNPAMGNPVTLMGESHYFFLDPKVQTQIIRETLARTKKILFGPRPDYTPHVQQIKNSGLPLKFAVVSDKMAARWETAQPLSKRIADVAARRRQYAEQPVFSGLIPITQTEMHHLMYYINLRAPFMNDRAIEGYLAEPQNYQLKQLWTERKLTNPQIIEFSYLFNNFPFDLYLSGLTNESQLSADIQAWVNHQEKIFPQPEQRKIIASLLEQIYYKEKAKLATPAASAGAPVAPPTTPAST